MFFDAASLWLLCFCLILQTLWANFQDICQLMKRQPEHVFSFVVAELGTEGSIDGNQRLVLRGQSRRPM